MNILHLLVDGPREDVDRLLDIQSRHHHVEVLDLSSKAFVYADLVDKIESHDRVVSWQSASGETAEAV